MRLSNFSIISENDNRKPETTHRKSLKQQQQQQQQQHLQRQQTVPDNDNDSFVNFVQRSARSPSPSDDGLGAASGRGAGGGGGGGGGGTPHLDFAFRTSLIERFAPEAQGGKSKVDYGLRVLLLTFQSREKDYGCVCIVDTNLEF